MDTPVADADEPGLRIRATGKQALGRCKRVIRHFERARFKVNRNNSAFVARFYPGPYLSLVYGVAAPGELFFTVTRLSCGHRFLSLSLSLDGVLFS